MHIQPIAAPKVGINIINTPFGIQDGIHASSTHPNSRSVRRNAQDSHSKACRLRLSRYYFSPNRPIRLLPFSSLSNTPSKLFHTAPGFCDASTPLQIPVFR